MQRGQCRGKGRPKIHKTENELLKLLELQFTQVEITQVKIARLYRC